jgi:hypothetical protein
MRLILNLPYFIFLWWVFIFFLVDTEFYSNNFEIINLVDIPFIVFSLSHFTFNMQKYSIKKVIFVICIVCVLILQLLYKYISNDSYYFIYSTLILLTFYVQIFITNGSKGYFRNQAKC